MAAVPYNGHVTMTYMDYIDTATGKTLVCVPGNSYSIAPASGHPSATTGTPTDGRFNNTASGREGALDEEEPDEEPDSKPSTRRGVTKQDTSTPEVKEN